MRVKFDKVHIEISNICNLQCSFCPEVIRSKKIMEVSLFEKIIEQVAPLTEQVCFHLMGEPLVHPELEALVEICARNEVKINLVSNGVLLNDKRATLLLNPAFRQVNFSLHSFYDNFKDKTNVTHFDERLDQYLEKIFAFTERAFLERPDLYINYRLWNLHDSQATATEATQSKPGNLTLLERIEKRFEWKFETQKTLDIRKQKSRKVKNRLYLHFDTEFIWPSLDLPVMGDKGFCHALSTHFGILADGTVVPCCLDKEGKIPLGNVTDHSITEILNAPLSQKILKGFRERRLETELCKRCNYIQRFN